MFNKKLIRLIPGIMPFIVKKSLVMWLSLICGIGVWLSFAHIIESAYFMTANKTEICILLGIIVICMILRYLLTRFLSDCLADIADKVKTRLRDMIYDKAAELGDKYTENFSTAEITQLASEGVEQAELYFTQYLPQLFYGVAAPITLFAVILPISVMSAVTLLVCIPLIPAAIAFVQTTAKKLLGKYWDAYTDLGDTFLENLQGLTTLKIYGADGAMHKRMNDDAERFRKITMKVLSMQLNSVTIMDIAACGGTAAGILIGCFGFSAGEVSLFGAAALVFLSGEFFVPMRLLGSYFHIAMNGVAASDKIFNLLEVPVFPNGDKEAQNGDLETVHMSFSYDGIRNVLNDVSIEIKKNSFTGICGESGCGKSTLAAIISGRRRNYSGNVRICGDEYTNISKKSLYEKITYVGCGDYIFSGSIRETLADAGRCSDEEMMNVLSSVDLADFVRGRGGLNMPVGQNGCRLSGGQKQRLSIARAFLKNSDIYIFDEATSNIDAESERAVLNAIQKIGENHTVIMVSHKLTNIENADMIYFMCGGEIKEKGSHGELMKENGEYSRIYSYQKEIEGYSEGRTAT